MLIGTAITTLGPLISHIGVAATNAIFAILAWGSFGYALVLHFVVCLM
jgi:hypothetical protein